jgi:hypothetical protein
MHALWQAIVVILVACTFLASVRIAVVGLNHVPTNSFWAFLTHDRWALTLFVFLPWYMGGLARREISALPWAEFSNALTRHGFIDALAALLIVITVELWFLWIPAHSYVLNRPQLDRRTAILARCLNLTVGLLLLTPQNPIYTLLALFQTGGPNEY